jgi:hypothetical protein
MQPVPDVTSVDPPRTVREDAASGLHRPGYRKHGIRNPDPVKFGFQQGINRLFEIRKARNFDPSNRSKHPAHEKREPRIGRADIA